MISSVSPSLKYSFSGRALRFTNGRTAIEGGAARTVSHLQTPIPAMRFAFETGHAVGVLREGVWQHLDRDFAIQLRVGGAVDGAHATFSKFGLDAMVGNAGRRSHVAGLCGMVSPSAMADIWISGRNTANRKLAI